MYPDVLTGYFFTGRKVNRLVDVRESTTKAPVLFGPIAYVYSMD